MYACIIAYDITNKLVLKFMYWINEIRQNNDNVKMVIVGNKTDLEEQRVVSFEDGLKMANYYDAPFFEVSSKDYVDHIFDKLVELVMEELECTMKTEKESVDENPLMKGIIVHDNIEIGPSEKSQNILISSLSRLGCCNN